MAIEIRSRVVLLAALIGLAAAGPGLSEGLAPEALSQMDACLVESAVSRDVANTTVACFNTAHRSCGADLVRCETDMTAALAERSEGLLARLPEDLEGVPDFAKERYQEILADIQAGSERHCADRAEAEQVSCAYSAQALRLAKLRSVGAQVDPGFLIP